jgi:hypothetical protein
MGQTFLSWQPSAPNPLMTKPNPNVRKSGDPGSFGGVCLAFTMAKHGHAWLPKITLVPSPCD